MANSSEFCVVITTTSSTEEAEKVARALLDVQLVACVQVYPMKSFYSWKGEICADDEIILLIKAKSSNYQEIENCIKSNHSYEVPEIIQIPIIDGSSSYLDWINQVSK
jgi:periplasmic divalent cation tolerance protein